MTKVISSDNSTNGSCYLGRHIKYVPLTPGEEIELCKEKEKGNKKALDKLVESQIPRVLKIANQLYYSSSKDLEFDDLVSIGTVGLCMAAKTFDYRKGKFYDHAHTAILRAILEYRKKEHRRGCTYGNIKKPANEENFFNILSLDMVISENSEGNKITGHDIIGGEYDYESKLDEEKLKELVSLEIDRLDKIDNRLPDIMMNRLGFNNEPLTLDETGRRFGITKQRVHILEKEAIRELKEIFK